VHGILVQSPLPSTFQHRNIWYVIHPKKDVDGFSSTNIARLYSGDETGLIPGTPKGIMKICFAYFQKKNRENENPQEEVHAVVIGKKHWSYLKEKPLYRRCFSHAHACRSNRHYLS
jgi:5,10-methylene-tetrahydrofolate dehydrogenase/methenyl tetrahydrofolate cyclohydrolase